MTTEQKNENLEKNRLKFFPIMMYAIVMGMSGLTISYQKAAHWIGFPHIIGSTLMYITTLIFFIVSIILTYFFLSYTGHQANILLISFGHAIILTIVEAISSKGLDNLTIPIASVLFMYLITMI